MKHICLQILKISLALSVFRPALQAREFSIRILLFGWMELDLPTPVSHPPSWETRLYSHAEYPQCVFIKMDVCKFKQKNFTNLTTTLSKLSKFWPLWKFDHCGSHEKGSIDQTLCWLNVSRSNVSRPNGLRPKDMNRNGSISVSMLYNFIVL